MTETNNETNAIQDAGDNVVDDRGTDASGGSALLKRLRDQGFDSDNEKFSLAMGRPVEEIAALMDGSEPPDDDIVMKARGIAKERGVEIE